MEILLSLKKLLSYVGITKQRHVRIAGVKVPRAFLLWFLIGSNTALIIMESFVSVKYSAIGIEAMLVPLHLTFAFGSVHLIFISLAWKRDQIMALIDYLEAVINRSRVSSLFFEISIIFRQFSKKDIFFDNFKTITHFIHKYRILYNFTHERMSALCGCSHAL